ncbi:hypothetical protein PoB_006985500 [Plakobranchus ocellatus]|uniref:Uncharacterized protein n=1 Tax=Plakobranchus ocellatus TaxID=259542 RepID=A0AAV4DH44_9GAST|nr:hypothetical protein PoB_006985500 [Plakobranchus ocellatus]
MWRVTVCLSILAILLVYDVSSGIPVSNGGKSCIEQGGHCSPFQQQCCAGLRCRPENPSGGQYMCLTS